MKSLNSIFGFFLLLTLAFNLFADLEARQTASSDTLQSYIEEGRNLFIGKTRLAEGGSSCLSCHTINDPELPISGGTLAINITGFGSLQPDALQERIIDIPYPHMVVMKMAYTNHPVTEQEADKLIAYLKHVAELQADEPTPLLAGLDFLWAGLAAFLVLLGLIWFSWRSRKKESVNEKIYQRQVQSV